MPRLVTALLVLCCAAAPQAVLAQEGSDELLEHLRARWYGGAAREIAAWRARVTAALGPDGRLGEERRLSLQEASEGRPVRGRRLADMLELHLEGQWSQEQASVLEAPLGDGARVECRRYASAEAARLDLLAERLPSGAVSALAQRGTELTLVVGLDARDPEAALELAVRLVRAATLMPDRAPGYAALVMPRAAGLRDTPPSPARELPRGDPLGREVAEAFRTLIRPDVVDGRRLAYRTAASGARLVYEQHLTDEPDGFPRYAAWGRVLAERPEQAAALLRALDRVQGQSTLPAGLPATPGLRGRVAGEDR